MGTRQLNVWIQEDLRGYVAKRAEKEERHMNDIVAELIQNDIARHDTQFVEQNSLLVIQELVAAEVRRAHAQLRYDLREDWQQETASFIRRIQRYYDRQLDLLVIAVRNSSMIRRLVYASLSKAYGSDFARTVYENAKEKTQEELAPKKILAEHVLRESP